MFFGRIDAETETPNFGHLMRRVGSLEKTLMLGGIEGRSRKGRLIVRWLVGITNSMHMILVELRELGWIGRPQFSSVQSLSRVRLFATP